MSYFSTQISKLCKFQGEGKTIKMFWPYRCIIVWAGPGFIESSLSAGDLFPSVVRMCFNFLFVWWLSVVGTSISSFLESLSGHSPLGYFLVRCIVVFSRFRNGCSIFSLHVAEFWVWSPNKWRVSVALPFPRVWDPVLKDLLFSWFLNLDPVPTVADLFWVNALSCLSCTARVQETRSSLQELKSCTRNSAELGVWNSLRVTPCQKQ